VVNTLVFKAKEKRRETVLLVKADPWKYVGAHTYACKRKRLRGAIVQTRKEQGRDEGP
jgi:hypothetical protein